MPKTESFTISPNAIGVIPGPRVSFIDHMVPLCHLMEIPVLCTDDWVAHCIEHYYPKTEVKQAWHSNFQETLAPYETFFVLSHTRIHPRACMFGEFLYKGSGKTVTALHGHPFKFLDTFWLEKLADEDVMLYYGDHLLEILNEKKIAQHFSKLVRIGNLRHQFYEAYVTFFDQVIQPHVFSQNGRKTLLYAPTWTYPEFNLSLDFLLPIPEEYQIIFKPHPYFFRLFPNEMEGLKARYADLEHLIFLEEMPLIYPLLKHVDFYLGDLSSVGYDFLSFNRPLFFMKEYGISFGTPIDLEHPYQSFEASDRCVAERERVYASVYGQPRPWDVIKKEILA